MGIPVSSCLYNLDINFNSFVTIWIYFGQYNLAVPTPSWFNPTWVCLFKLHILLHETEAIGKYLQNLNPIKKKYPGKLRMLAFAYASPCILLLRNVRSLKMAATCGILRCKILTAKVARQIIYLLRIRVLLKLRTAIEFFDLSVVELFWSSYFYHVEDFDFLLNLKSF